MTDQIPCPLLPQVRDIICVIAAGKLPVHTEFFCRQFYKSYSYRLYGMYANTNLLALHG